MLATSEKSKPEHLWHKQRKIEEIHIIKCHSRYNSTEFQTRSEEINDVFQISVNHAKFIYGEVTKSLIILMGIPFTDNTVNPNPLAPLRTKMANNTLDSETPFPSAQTSSSLSFLSLVSILPLHFQLLRLFFQIYSQKKERRLYTGTIDFSTQKHPMRLIRHAEAASEGWFQKDAIRKTHVQSQP